MANFNKVILAGNLTRDPQLSYLPSNMPVAKFGLAINRKWKSQNGEMRDDTCFVDCTCLGKQAEVYRGGAVNTACVTAGRRKGICNWHLLEEEVPISLSPALGSALSPRKNRLE